MVVQFFMGDRAACAGIVEAPLDHHIECRFAGLLFRRSINAVLVFHA